VGNKWFYRAHTWWADSSFHQEYSTTVREVFGDTVMPNGHLYYEISDYTTLDSNHILYERIDSSSGKVYRYDETLGLPGNEYLIDDLLAEPGDTVMSSRQKYNELSQFICNDEDTIEKFGHEEVSKTFAIYDLTGYTYRLAHNFGLDSVSYSWDFGGSDIILKGCIINGVVYGDTITVFANNDQSGIPKEYSLIQNYPNPFNPATTIQYSVAGRRIVTLKVYDILGREVATLVNKEKNPGVYEIKFDGSKLSSGVYFYRIQAGNFVQTKKMLLLK
jgi:Secretion system C-terminal sorting domain